MSESQNIEYKESWRDEYLKWICGFANAQGGRIYIGIDDNQQVVGVADTKRLMEDIPNKIVNYLDIVADVNLLHKEDKDYIEIAVQPCNLPIAYHGIYHYRSGSTKQELKGAALQQFLLRKMGHSWDDIENERATLDDIDRQAIDFFLRKAVDAGRMPVDSLNETTEKVLSNLNLIGGEGKLRNAALLLFGKNPAKFFTSVQFRIGRFGRDEADLMFHGRIYIGIDDNQQVVGVADTKRLMEDIPNKIVNYLDIVADVNLLHKEDKDYIEIAVQPCNLPIAYHGIYHYRSGSTKQELKGAALQQFLLRKMGHSWDDIENERATLDDIDRQAIDFFLRKAVDAGRMPVDSLNETTEKVLSNLNLIGGEGKLRNAALLLFGKNPAKFFTSVQFRIGRFGRDEADLMFQDVVDGNIIQMTDRVIEVLKSKNDDPLNDPLNDPLKLSSLEKDILKLIVKDNQSTYDNLAISLSVSSATIKRAFRNLKVNGCIIRKGSKKIGYWMITEKGKSILK